MTEGNSDAKVTQLEIKTETEAEAETQSPKGRVVDLFSRVFRPQAGFDSQGRWSKCQIVAAPVIFLSIGLLLVGLGISFFALRDLHKDNFAPGVWNKIQLKVQPCDNFYEYACGNWFEHIRDESPFRKKLRKDYYRETEKVLRNGQSELDVEENIRNYFNSCLTAVENKSIPELDYLKSIVMTYDPSQTVEAIFQEAQDSSDGVSLVCTRLTEHYFYFAVTTMQLKYSGSGFHPEAVNQKWIKNLREMVENIRSEFITFLEKSGWLDLETKEMAIDKLEHTKIMIGYEGSNFVRNSHLLDKYYTNDGKMNPENFTENMNTLFNSSRIKMEQESLFLPEPFITFPSIQNNNNDEEVVSEGSFVIPLGLLQPPFYDPEGSSSINYGSLGTAIGHQLYHNLPLLLNDTNYFDCFSEQYSKFKYENGKSFNANFSIQEIIADNGGLQVATRALWRQLLKEQQAKNESQRNSSVNDLTYKQTFFISFAQSWCGHDHHYEEEDHEHGIESGMAIHSHLEPKFRVLGAIQNSPEFKDVFNCPLDSFMVNDEECSIF